MGALAGLKVVEMAAIGPVPLAGMMLADLGADVVVVDKVDDSMVLPGDIMRRGKCAIEVDIKSSRGNADVKTLLDQADIVLEGFRPGVMERLGLGPEQFDESNPGLIYGRMTGWGQDGPLSQAAAHDLNYIALTGALHAMGRPDSPPPPPLNLVGDYGGGTLFLLVGVLAALHERSRSGKGQVVDAAITEGTANLMTLIYTLSNIGQWTTRRGSNLLDSAPHYYDCYETSDGKFISVGAIEPHFYKLLCEKLNLDDGFSQQNDPRDWPRQKAEISNIFKQRTRDEWCELLEGTDACFAPVLDFQEAAQHPHMQARGAYLEREGKLQPAPAPRLSRTPSRAGEACQHGLTITDVLAAWQC